jgi:hypothetical protein
MKKGGILEFGTEVITTADGTFRFCWVLLLVHQQQYLLWWT